MYDLRIFDKEDNGFITNTDLTRIMSSLGSNNKYLNQV